MHIDESLTNAAPSAALSVRQRTIAVSYADAAAQRALHEPAELVGVLAGQQQAAMRGRAGSGSGQLAGPEAAVRAEAERIVRPVGAHPFARQSLGAGEQPVDLGDDPIRCFGQCGEGAPHRATTAGSVSTPRSPLWSSVVSHR